MSKLKNVRAVVALAVSAVGCTAAFAEVVVTNLAEPLRATTEIGNNPNPVSPPSLAPDWSWAAQSFITDGNAYSLTRIDMIAGDESAAPVVVAELRADNAGAIGALITTLIVPDLTGAPSPRNFFPSAAVTLDPATTYWVVLGSEAPGDGTLGWSYANTNNSVGTGVISTYADSQDSGASWNYGTKNPYFIQVVADRTKPCNTCPGDANGDGVVNFDDITSVLSNWLNSCP